MSGHIQTHGPGSHTIIVEAGRNPATGKRKRIKKAFHGSKKAAKEEMARLETEVKKGTYIEPSKITFGEYVKSWMEDYSKLKHSPTTYRRYSQIINLRIIPWLGAIMLDKLKPYHLQQFFKRVIEEGRMDGREGVLSSASIIYHHKVIHRILEVAYKQELIPKNVADLVDLPIPDDDDDEKEPVAILTDEHLKRLEKASRDTPYYGMIFVDARTGLRRGELLGLQWKDIDLDAGTLAVRRSLTYTPETGIFFKPPKNKKSRRAIDISPDVVAYLRWHHKNQSEQRLKKGPEYKNKDLIFCQDNGEPLHPDTISSWFPEFLEKLIFHKTCDGLIENEEFCPHCKKKPGKDSVIKLPRLKFHALRHTHASLLLALGEDIKLISERLGHSSIRITYDIYSHLLPAKQKQAVSRLDELLR